MKNPFKSLRKQFFDKSEERKQIARNVERVRTRLDRQEILTGLCLFVAATHYVPDKLSIQQVLSTVGHSTYDKKAGMSNANLQSLL